MSDATEPRKSNVLYQNEHDSEGNVDRVNHVNSKSYWTIHHRRQIFSWWRSTVVRTSFYDRWTFPGLRHDVQLTGDLLGVNRPLYVTQHTQPFILLGSINEQLGIRVVAPTRECLWVKADMVLFAAGDIVWSTSVSIRGIREDELYKSTLPLPLPFRKISAHGKHHVKPPAS